MTGNWLRRIIMLAACASVALLAGCGSSVESALTPSRFISFGDAFSDVGNIGVNNKYTVNDGSVNNWTQQLASSYGLSITPSNSGGLGYAQGNARIAVTPDAAGNSATKTVTQQIDTFLASNTLQPNDVVLINGGISDIVAEWAAMTAGTETQAQMTANVTQAAKNLGAQVQRLVNAGAQHVVVVGPYDLSVSPWAVAIGQPRLSSLLSTTTVQFNDALLLSIVNLGANVLYVDAAFYFNLLTASPASYSPLGTTGNYPTPVAVCTSVDPGPGIGIGANQVNSSLCTTSTILAGVDYTTYLFADALYFAPSAQRLFGTNAYSKLSTRW
ncbi:MAG: SGNH/GDSL hydrolase family protein [Rhodoferax sp.]|nr:SGNH/GDSL hydrolase family protein [Rhodoferax sp.]